MMRTRALRLLLSFHVSALLAGAQESCPDPGAAAAAEATCKSINNCECTDNNFGDDCASNNDEHCAEIECCASCTDEIQAMWLCEHGTTCGDLTCYTEEHCEDFDEDHCEEHGCEWHEDHGDCHDAGEHCEDFDEDHCEEHGCEWHADDGMCEDIHCEDFDEDHCEDHGCEWHADEQTCEGGDDHDHDHDDEGWSCGTHPADTDGNGVIDINDILNVLGMFGQTL